MRFNVLGTAFLLAVALVTLLATAGFADERPNILWLSTEDIGPHVGCYGDEVANTPNLDAFAKRGLVFKYAWSNYPVCAPARTTIITGMYACANGAGNMRSEVKIPDGVKMFPEYLREAGYFCTNNSKTDYNYEYEQHQPWDISSNKAHYRKRKKGQPFFAVFNYTGTHESKIRKRPHTAVVDPASVKLPKYWPDTPEFRQDFAQYYDNINVMDGWIKKQLDALEKSGESDNTIVVFFGDHGSGMPRHKRYAGDSGMLVPFVVHVPEKLKEQASKEYVAGGKSDRPVGFVDLAPTMLSIAGIEPPEYMQGHAFLGKFQTDAPKYLYGFRQRMDERIDISRSLRDQRFIYVRNYMPHLPAGQALEYQLQTPSCRVWKDMFEAGKLNEVQSKFWQPHQAEELYDLAADPDETVNLVGDPKFEKELERFRTEHRESMMRFGDVGLVPEQISFEFGQAKRSRREMLDDSKQFPMQEIFSVANLAANRNLQGLEKLHKAMEHESASVRYWGAIGIQVDGKKAVNGSKPQLKKLLSDNSPAVAIVAAELLVQFGDENEQASGLSVLKELANLDNSNLYGSIQALNAIDRLAKQKTSPIFPEIENIPLKIKQIKRGENYVGSLLRAIAR